MLRCARWAKALSLWIFLDLGLGACSEPRPHSTSRVTSPAAELRPAVAPLPPRQVFVDTLEVPGDQPVFALRGGREEGVVGVVFHGWCSHGMGYLQAFQWAAADAGRFIALQGDHHCGNGPMRGWTNDVVGLDRRIDAALRVYLGAEPPRALVLIGGSQGAERAIDLARAYPQKYRWLVLASGPHEAPARGLSQLEAAYFLVGEHEGQFAMRRSHELWRRAGLRTELEVIHGAGHADFHGQGDALMRRVFAFLNAC